MSDIKPCYICKDTEGEKDKYHHSRCLKCKRELAKSYGRINHQNKLEKKYNDGEKHIIFCVCGNYFIDRKLKKINCQSCKRIKNGLL